MKKFLALGLIGLSVQVLAADSVDYSYCQQVFTPDLIGFDYYGESAKKDFPYKLGNDGKVTAHKDVNYKYDEKTKTETMTYEAGYPGFKSQQEIIIKRDKNGHLSQVISSSSYKGMKKPKTKSGLGTKKGFTNHNPNMQQIGGLGFPGFGVNPYGGFNGGPSKHTVVNDVKIKSGKCFPYRSVNLSEVNDNTHQSFGSDIQLCRDLKDFYKEQHDGDSKLGKLKACYDSYRKEAQKVIASHKKRNADLYNPKDEMEDGNPWKTGGYGEGFNAFGGGGFASGEAGGKLVMAPQEDLG